MQAGRLAASSHRRRVRLSVSGMELKSTLHVASHLNRHLTNNVVQSCLGVAHLVQRVHSWLNAGSNPALAYEPDCL